MGEKEDLKTEEKINEGPAVKHEGVGRRGTYVREADVAGFRCLELELAVVR